ncbi:hypothetical protein MICAER10613_011720 [Microcystis aeruginosa]
MLKGATLPPEVKMGNSTTFSDTPFHKDHHTWEHLKQAIAASSGFRRWQQEQLESGKNRDDADAHICSYLRETLETLAY